MRALLIVAILCGIAVAVVAIIPAVRPFVGLTGRRVQLSLDIVAMLVFAGLLGYSPWLLVHLLQAHEYVDFAIRVLILAAVCAMLPAQWRRWQVRRRTPTDQWSEIS